MYAHKISTHLIRKPVPFRLAVGALVALTMLSAACSNDSASRINAPPTASLNRSDDGSHSSTASGSNFTVLAKTAVSCSGGSITGDVGTFQAPGDLPPGVVTLTTGCVVNGTVHVGDAAAKAAFNSFLTAYTTLAPKTGDCDLAHTLLSTIPASVTLPPGTYCTGAALTATDVTLTLDALGNPNAVWLFKIGTSAPGALTGTRFSVVLVGANACNVTWWVDAATTMSNSVFKGNILAGGAISMTGGTLTGNAWSKADVTFTGGTVVTGCAGSNGNGNGDDDKDKDHDKDKHHDKDHDKDKGKCNQGIGNGREGCDPGNSDHHNGSNDEGDGNRGHSDHDSGR